MKHVGELQPAIVRFAAAVIILYAAFSTFGPRRLTQYTKVDPGRCQNLLHCTVLRFTCDAFSDCQRQRHCRLRY